MNKNHRTKKSAIFSYSRAFPIRRPASPALYLEAKEILCASLLEFKKTNPRSMHPVDEEPFLFDAFVFEIGKYLINRRELESVLMACRESIKDSSSEEVIRKKSKKFFKEITRAVEIFRGWGATNETLAAVCADLERNPEIEIFKLYKMVKGGGFIKYFDGVNYMNAIAPGRLFNGPSKLMALVMIDLLKGFYGSDCGPNKFVVDIYKLCRQRSGDDNCSDPWGNTKKLGTHKKRNWLDEFKQIMRSLDGLKRSNIYFTEGLYEVVFDRIKKTEDTPKMKQYRARIKSVSEPIVGSEKNAKKQLRELEALWAQMESNMFWDSELSPSHLAIIHSSCKK